jgi:hypothetical protein
MTGRLSCWTLGLALLCPAALASAQSPAPQEPDQPRRLRIEIPPLIPSPLDVTPTPGSSGDLRTLATCPTCPTDDDRPPVTAATAPWRLGAFYTVGDAFNHVTFGVVGQRNERLPLFMSVPIGAPIGPAPPPSSANATLDTRTHWLATIAAEKSLNGNQSGRALRVLGEVFLPLGTFAPKPASLDPPSPSGGAVRGALRVPF